MPIQKSEVIRADPAQFGISESDVISLLADGNVGDVLTQTGVGTVGMQTPDPGYFEYVAVLSQSGTNAPTAAVIKSTLGLATLSRLAQGTYRLTINNAFPAASTYLQQIIFCDPEFDLFVIAYRDTDSRIIIYSYSAGVLNDSLINNVHLRVKVYH